MIQIPDRNRRFAVAAHRHHSVLIDARDILIPTGIFCPAGDVFDVSVRVSCTHQDLLSRR